MLILVVGKPHKAKDIIGVMRASEAWILAMMSRPYCFLNADIGCVGA